MADLNWTVLADFSAGIWNRNYQGGTHTRAPWGAASAQNTYRCISLPGGGLGPLPRRTQERYSPTTGIESSPAKGYFVGGFYVPEFAFIEGTGSDFEEIFFGVEWVKDSGSGDQRKFRLFRWNGAAAVPTFDTIFSKDLTAAVSHAGNFGRAVTFGTTRSNPTDQTLPGVPVVAFAWYQPGGSTASGQSIVGVFPNPSNPSVIGIQTVSSSLDADITTHQGRIFMMDLTDYRHGPTGGITSNEEFHWTAVNNVGSITTANAATVGHEAAGGYAAWQSMTAGELLLIRRSADGGLLITGDLDNPTVFTLPNLPGIGIDTLGTTSTIGYVYSTDYGGVWAWAGGDTAEKISPQMKDDFWHVTRNIIGPSARWANWTDWIVGPNLWLFDAQNTQGAWWRLDNTADYPRNLVSFQASSADRHRLYGSVDKFTAPGDAFLWEWDKRTPARSWSWQSHNLYVTTDRVINVREIVVVAQGANQTLTVTLTGTNGATSVSTITLNSTSAPKMFRLGVSLRAENLKVRIEADATAANVPAALVYEVRIGTVERMHLAAS